LGFEEIERRLELILDGLDKELSAAERNEVVHFIEVGEYGVALETLSALLTEEQKKLPAAVFSQIKDLAEAMGIQGSTITASLERLVG
jgi:predicted DNA binding protein